MEVLAASLVYSAGRACICTRKAIKKRCRFSRTPALSITLPNSTRGKIDSAADEVWSCQAPRPGRTMTVMVTAWSVTK